MTKEEEYRSAGIEYQEGVGRFVGQAKLYETFLNKFLQDPNYEELKKALQARDCEAAFQASHTLKGVSGNLSLNSLFHAIIPLVDSLRGEATSIRPWHCSRRWRRSTRELPLLSGNTISKSRCRSTAMCFLLFFYSGEMASHELKSLRRARIPAGNIKKWRAVR